MKIKISMTTHMTQSLTFSNLPLHSDECEPENPCLHGGECIDGLNEHTCQCLPGYTGDHCEHRITVLCGDDACEPSGVCYEDYRQSNGTCVCGSGYSSGELTLLLFICGFLKKNLLHKMY